MTDTTRYELNGIAALSSLVSLPSRYFEIVTRERVSAVGMTDGDLARLSALPYCWMEPGKIKHRLDCAGALVVWTLWQDRTDEHTSLSVRGRARIFAKDIVRIREITHLMGVPALAA